MNLKSCNKEKGEIYEWCPPRKEGGGVFVFLVIGETKEWIATLPLLDTTNYRFNDIKQICIGSEVEVDCKLVT